MDGWGKGGELEKWQKKTSQQVQCTYSFSSPCLTFFSLSHSLFYAFLWTGKNIKKEIGWMEQLGFRFNVNFFFAFFFSLSLSLSLAASLVRKVIHFARKLSHAVVSLSLSLLKTFRIPFTEWILNEAFYDKQPLTLDGYIFGWCCGGGGSMDGNLKKRSKKKWNFMPFTINPF